MPSLGKLNNGCEYNILPSPLRRELAHKKDRSVSSNGSSTKSSSSSLNKRTSRRLAGLSAPGASSRPSSIRDTASNPHRGSGKQTYATSYYNLSYHQNRRSKKQHYPKVSRTNEVEEIDDSDDEGKKRFFNISPRFSSCSYFQPLDVDITVGNTPPTNSDAPSAQSSKKRKMRDGNEQSVQHNAKRGCNRRNVAHNSHNKLTAGSDGEQRCKAKDAIKDEQCTDVSTCNHNNEDIREEEMDNDVYVHNKSNAGMQRRDTIITAISEEENSSANKTEERLGDVTENDVDDKQQHQNQRNTATTSNRDFMSSELSDIREMTYRQNEYHIKYTLCQDTEKRLLSEEKLVKIFDHVLAIFGSGYCWDKVCLICITHISISSAHLIHFMFNSICTKLIHKVSRIVDKVIGWKDDGIISDWKDCLLGRMAFRPPSLVALLDTIDFSDERESKYRVKMAFLLFLALNLHRSLSHNNGIIQRAGKIPDEVKTFFFGLFLSQMDNGGYFSTELQKDTFNTFIFILYILAGGKDMSVRKINHLWRDMNIDDDYASTLLRSVEFMVEKNGTDVNVSLPSPLKVALVK